MDKIDINKIRTEIKKHLPGKVAKETGITYRQVYDFLRKNSDNPTLRTVNAMIDFINRHTKK